jgi:hypothetical protein
MKRIVLLACSATVALAVGACGGDPSESTPTPVPTLNPADFSATIDNPLFPLSSLGPKVFEGDETDPDTGETVHARIEHTVLPETVTVAGIEVTVLQDKEYADGEIIEIALDHFAQHRDGSVWYLGELVDIYEDGEVVSHEGQWLTGEGQNQAGIYMPAEPAVGQAFNQENAPGIAEDRFEVIALDQTVTVPAGTFTGCLKTEDSSPLDDTREFKYYCPGLALVREEPSDGTVDLISYE